MEQLTGKTGEELAAELRGVIFRLPGPVPEGERPQYVTADEYLFGNVRRKLRQAQRAAEQDPAFTVNVEALNAAQPKDLDASEIEVRLGATWIDKEYIQQFMYETFDTPFYLQRGIEVHYRFACLSKIIIALFPFKYPINCEILYLGGTLTSRCTWSGIICSSMISTPFHLHKSFMISLISALS